MKVKEIAFTCYPVSDMPRARAFYEGVLGLTPGMTTQGEHGTQWVEYEIGPHVLSIGCAPGFEPSEHGGTAALEVEDFDEAIQELRAAKVRFRIEPIPTPVCRMAIVYDPDGNSITIHKRNSGRE
jgi:catechol 2,3-dioxygenase-like lactoylglutathione lyase family enzyme